MNALEISIIVGFMLGTLSMWIANLINNRYTQQERKLSLLALKRAKRD